MEGAYYTKNKWINIKQRIVLNTPKIANGLFWIYVIIFKKIKFYLKLFFKVSWRFGLTMSKKLTIKK